MVGGFVHGVMTNKFGNWSRLAAVIEWSGRKTISLFARIIGVERSESLYHIRRGNYGISHELADRITQQYGDIDRTWLLSGVGEMLKTTRDKSTELSYYKGSLESVISNLGSAEPYSKMVYPYYIDCDFVIRCESREMTDALCAATELFLKREDVDDIVQGNEYVVATDAGEVLWRKMRYAQNKKNTWRLVSRNREDFPDILLSHRNIKAAWRVIAKTTIMTK